MEQINFRKATSNDIETLASLRTEFLIELLGPQKNESVTELRKQLTGYLQQSMPNGTYVSYVAINNDYIVSTGGMTIRDQPGNFKNPTGKVGYIMNMYTIPEFRKRGISTAILNLLMAEAKELGITALELHATKEGESIYIKSGFKLHSEPTYRKYDNQSLK